MSLRWKSSSDRQFGEAAYPEYWWSKTTFRYERILRKLHEFDKLMSKIPREYDPESDESESNNPNMSERISYENPICKTFHRNRRWSSLRLIAINSQEHDEEAVDISCLHILTLTFRRPSHDLQKWARRLYLLSCDVDVRNWHSSVYLQERELCNMFRLTFTLIVGDIRFPISCPVQLFLNTWIRCIVVVISISSDSSITFLVSLSESHEIQLMKRNVRQSRQDSVQISTKQT